MNQIRQLERKSRLWHIERAGRKIVEFVAGHSLEDYSADEVLSSAVERQFIIIGEALGRALEVDPELVAEIPDARAIIGLRNQLVHNYPHVDPERIWDIIEQDLPSLLARVRDLLGAPPA